MTALVAPWMFALIERITAATTVRDVWAIYLQAARDAGLEYGIACFLPDDRSIGETTFANDFPDGWLENYVARGHQQIDPMMRLNHESAGLFSWNLDDWDGLLSERQEAWRSDNRQAGIHAGITIPDRSDNHLKIITLCGRHNPLDVQDRRALHYAGLEALFRMHQLGLKPAYENFPVLSPRERECLQWMAAGKSDWEIGQILSISEKTVSTHVDRVKHKLGVGTRAQVLVSAMRHGAIDS